MSDISDEQLLEHATRIRDKVLLITGGGNGVGKATALMFAQYGAKVVIGDLNIDAAKDVADSIVNDGGQAVWAKCDVTNWDDQVALFQLAIKMFGAIDVVIPNAGIADTPIMPLREIEGKPVAPSLATMKINVDAVLYTCSLAFHYIQPSADGDGPDRLKALILVGSMTSYQAIYSNVQYTSSKHAVLGMLHALGPMCAARGMRCGSVHPWFMKTQITKQNNIKRFVTGWPMLPVERVAAAQLCIATHPDPRTSGLPWLMPDGREVYRLDRAELSRGVYEELNARAARVTEMKEMAWRASRAKM